MARSLMSCGATASVDPFGDMALADARSRQSQEKTAPTNLLEMARLLPRRTLEMMLPLSLVTPSPMMLALCWYSGCRCVRASFGPVKDAALVPTRARPPGHSGSSKHGEAE